jgi:NADPH2:quinone reductase
MKSIVLSNPGKPSTYIFKDFPIPEPLSGHVVIEIKAFGTNHAEMHMRKGEWAETAEVSGIECVGLVHSCPGGEFAVGTKVAALMGGMGRSIPGSYAEYTRVPASNVASIESNLSWEELAAIPESYATAWTCVFQNLELATGQTLLVRGGTSSLGQAAINLAVNAGAKVIATARNLDRTQMLLDLGVRRVELEGPDLSERLPEKHTIDAVLNLVGNSVMIDSLAIPKRGGRVCLAGFLGGLAPISDFNPLLQMPSGVHFSFFGSFHFGTPSFPLSDVPLQKIADDVARGSYKAKPSKVFRFEDIAEAHKVMEESRAGGKLVVKVGKD